MYKPNLPFNVHFMLMSPTTYTAKGSTKKAYEEKGEIYCSYRTFGGTEVVKNGVLTAENTAVIETYYRPDIKSDCRIVDENGQAYEIIGTPENINRRNQYLKFKVRAVAGGV